MHTTRFGTVVADNSDVIHFPHALPGLAHCERWLLLADAAAGAVGWLQSADQSEVALAVVDPRRFVPEYALHLASNALGPLYGGAGQDMRVLAIVGRDDHGLTLNLKAPLVIDLRRRLGCQVINRAEWPLGYSLVERTMPLRRSA